MTDTEQRPWLAKLQSIAPTPETFWHRTFEWEHVDPSGAVPVDFRATFEAFDAHEFLVDEPEDSSALRILALHVPWVGSEREALHVDEAVWETTKGPLKIVGTSRSDEPRWADVAVPDVPCPGVAWASFDSGSVRTVERFVWAPVDQGLRATIVVSAHRAEAWALVMPADEILVRFLTGTTGCPWLDRGKTRANPHVSIAALWLEDEPPFDRHMTAETGKWVRGGTPAVPDTASEGHYQPAQLATDPAGFEEPDLEAARRDLDALCRLVPPPASAGTPPDWDAIEKALGGAVRQDVKDLFRTYGAGTLSDRDENAERPVDMEFALLPEQYVDLQDARALASLDVSDLVGDRPSSDLRAITWCTVENGVMDELWLWRVDGDHGIARNSDDVVRRLPGSAAAQVAAAVLGTDQFQDLGRDADRDEFSVTFEPR